MESANPPRRRSRRIQMFQLASVSIRFTDKSTQTSPKSKDPLLTPTKVAPAREVLKPILRTPTKGDGSYVNRSGIFFTPTRTKSPSTSFARLGLADGTPNRLTRSVDRFPIGYRQRNVSFSDDCSKERPVRTRTVSESGRSPVSFSAREAKLRQLYAQLPKPSPKKQRTLVKESRPIAKDQSPRGILMTGHSSRSQKMLEAALNSRKSADATASGSKLQKRVSFM